MEKIRNPKDITNGVENIPIPLEVAKYMNEAVDFVYVRHSVPGAYCMHKEFQEQYEGCDCSSSKVCSESECECVMRFQCPYTEDGKLKDVDPYSDSMNPILECNKKCKCGPDCHTRVVQSGIKVKLQVFVTKDKRGFGLRALQDISAMTFVCEYAGEVLNKEVAKKRSMLQTADDNNYILAVREHTSSNDPIITYVDPTFIGNTGRFINHSCQPNLFMVPVRVNNGIPKIALFALRDISSGEELCYDYSGEIQKEAKSSTQDLDTSQEQIETIVNGKLRTSGTQRKACLCGTSLCRGFLPFDESLYKKE